MTITTELRAIAVASEAGQLAMRMIIDWPFESILKEYRGIEALSGALRHAIDSPSDNTEEDIDVMRQRALKLAAQAIRFCVEVERRRE